MGVTKYIHKRLEWTGRRATLMGDAFWQQISSPQHEQGNSAGGYQ